MESEIKNTNQLQHLKYLQTINSKLLQKYFQSSDTFTDLALEEIQVNYSKYQNNVKVFSKNIQVPDLDQQLAQTYNYIKEQKQQDLIFNAPFFQLLHISFDFDFEILSIHIDQKTIVNQRFFSNIYSLSVYTIALIFDNKNTYFQLLGFNETKLLIQKARKLKLSLKFKLYKEIKNLPQILEYDRNLENKKSLLNSASTEPQTQNQLFIKKVQSLQKKNIKIIMEQQEEKNEIANQEKAYQTEQEFKQNQIPHFPQNYLNPIMNQIEFSQPQEICQQNQNNYYTDNESIIQVQSIVPSQIVDKIQENSQQKAQNQLFIIPVKVQNKKCEFCLEDVIKERKLNCSHIFHEECLLEQFRANYSSGLRLFSNYKCLAENCCVQIDLTILKELLKENMYQQIAQQSADIHKTFACPNIKCQNSIIIEKQSIIEKQIQLLCPNCSQQICSLCLKKWHNKNKTGEQCPTDQQLINKALSGEEKVVCPFCKTIALKDEGCNHVKCANCQKELCFVCSVDRRPILAHGNHYHREGCRDYQAYNGNADFKPGKCEVCRINNKACDRPEKLEIYKKQNRHLFG